MGLSKQVNGEINSNMKLWVQIGEDGDRHSFHDMEEALEYLNDASVGQVTSFLDEELFVGFETPNFHGDDHVRCYWGSATGEIMDELTIEDRRQLTEKLSACFL